MLYKLIYISWIMVVVTVLVFGQRHVKMSVPNTNPIIVPVHVLAHTINK